MVVAQTRLDRIRARVCYNSDHFEFQFDSNFYSSLSDLKRNLLEKFEHRKQLRTLPFLVHNGCLQKKPTIEKIGIRF